MLMRCSGSCSNTTPGTRNRLREDLDILDRIILYLFLANIDGSGVSYSDMQPCSGTLCPGATSDLCGPDRAGHQSQSLSISTHHIIIGMKTRDAASGGTVPNIKWGETLTETLIICIWQGRCRRAYSMSLPIAYGNLFAWSMPVNSWMQCLQHTKILAQFYLKEALVKLPKMAYVHREHAICPLLQRPCHMHR